MHCFCLRKTSPLRLLFLLLFLFLLLLLLGLVSLVRELHNERGPLVEEGNHLASTRAPSNKVVANLKRLDARLGVGHADTRTRELSLDEFHLGVWIVGLHALNVNGFVVGEFRGAVVDAHTVDPRRRVPVQPQKILEHVHAERGGRFAVPLHDGDTPVRLQHERGRGKRHADLSSNMRPSKNGWVRVRQRMSINVASKLKVHHDVDLAQHDVLYTILINKVSYGFFWCWRVP